LQRSIESVLAQTYSEFELLLINDGSTDESEDCILDYQKRDSRIKYIKQKNMGVSQARNTGIKSAKYKYLTFLDADDTYDKNFLYKMVSKIKDKNVCYCGHFFVSANKKKRAKLKFSCGDILENYL